MATFGNISLTNDGQETSDVRAWGLVNSSYTHVASAGDTITELYAYMKSYNAGDFTFDIAIYEVSGGIPTNRVGSAQTVIGNGSTPQFYGVTGLSLSLSAGTEYCICVGALTNGARLHTNTDAANSSSLQSSSGTLGATWNEFLQYAYILLAYATYTEGGSGISIDHTREVAVLTQGGISLDRLSPVNTSGELTIDRLLAISTLIDISMRSILPIETLKSISARLELNIGNDSERSFSREIPVLVDMDISLDRFMHIENLSTVAAFSTIKNLNIDWRIDSSHVRIIPIDSLAVISFIRDLPVSTLKEISGSLIMNIGSGKDFVFSFDLPISTLKSLSLTKVLPVEYDGQSVFGIILSNFIVRTPNINNFIVRTPNINNLRKS